jgi:hypothetical protein
MENSTILKACGDSFEYGVDGGECIIEFTETGYNIIKDTRATHKIDFLNEEFKGGYLHICEESAEEITEACRNQIIKYFYNHDKLLPGLGATVTERYFKGLTREEAEKIGNEGKKAFYNS